MLTEIQGIIEEEKINNQEVTDSVFIQDEDYPEFDCPECGHFNYDNVIYEYGVICQACKETIPAIIGNSND